MTAPTGPTGPPPVKAGPASHPPTGRIIALAFGAIGVLVGLACMVTGGSLVLAHATQRDASGFFTSGSERLETVTYAVTSDEIDLGTDPGRRERRFDLGDLATVRISARSAQETPVFVGIGPTADVDRYLDGVATARIDDVRFAPFGIRYAYQSGGAPAGPPADEGFWAATAEGSGRQSLEWDLESGQWSVVVMNADASPGVAVDTAIGAKVDWVLPLGLALLAFALLSLLGGAALLVFGGVGLARRLDQAPPPGPATQGAVALSGRLDKPSRWLWLVKPILVIPHLLVLALLWLAVSVIWVVAFFAVLFTGRYPRSLFDFVVGVLRWSWRVGYYSFSALGTDAYPPFTLADAPDYPATLHITCPESLSRWLVLVKWWLLAIPHYLVLVFVIGGLGVRMAGGLLGLLVCFVGFALLFSDRYPGGLFDLVMGLNRWVYRVAAYVLLLTDEYPPFRLDQGGDEPSALVGALDDD